MSGKNYGDIRHLAMGDLSHEAVANLLVQQNASSPNLHSVLRAGHDRILHLASTATVATNDSEIETLRRQLADANARVEQFSGELTAALSNVAVEKERADTLQGQVNQLSADLQHIRDNYDLSDLEGETDGDDSADAENEIDNGPREAYMPSRAEIKEIALANGFRVPQGADDLKPYVYVTVEKAVELAHSRS